VRSRPGLAGGFDDAEESVAEVLRREAISPPQQSRWQAFVRRSLRCRNLIITLLAIALFILFSAATEHFLAADNLLNILRNLSFIGIVAVGMTYLLSPASSISRLARCLAF
jgi:ABC-type xylose transport system permease subunit